MWIFRAMKINSENKPELGRTARTLGVRTPRDIVPDDDGYVYPEVGGMSIAPHNPKLLPLHRRPPSLGGSGRDPVFKFHISSLPDSLIVRLDKPEHGMVEPAQKCLLTQYEQELSSTQSSWELFNE